MKILFLAILICSSFLFPSSSFASHVELKPCVEIALLHSEQSLHKVLVLHVRQMMKKEIKSLNKLKLLKKVFSLTEETTNHNLTN